MRNLLFLLLVFSFASPSYASFERLIFEDNFTEASDVYLDAHTPDYTFFGGQYFEMGGASYDCKISGAQDAVTEGPGTNPIFTNYFSLGAYTFPARHDFTFRHAAYGTSVLYCFRRNDKNNTDGLQTLFTQTYYSGGTTASLYLRQFNGSIQTLATTTIPSFSLAKTWNMIIDDTGTNIKVYCDSVADGDTLGVATTLYLDIDTTLHNGLTNLGYRCDSSGGTGNMFIYHIKTYDSLIPTATPTHSQIGRAHV